MSTDAWEAYKSSALLAVPQDLGHAVPTVYGVVENAPLTTAKRYRVGTALILAGVADLASRALLHWRRSGQVEPDLADRLECSVSVAQERMSQLREMRALELEERILIRARRCTEGGTRLLARLNEADIQARRELCPDDYARGDRNGTRRES